jgi:siroheme synthase-like protein
MSPARPSNTSSAISLKFSGRTAEDGNRSLFPVFLKLTGRRVVVVGGGPVATTKIAGLLGTGAEILVVAPGLTGELRDEARRRPDRLTIVERAFQPADLDGAWLAIAAAPPEVNRQVTAAAEAGHRRVFVVAVDDPQAATAFGGGTLRRGGVTFAISTDGQAPALAGLLREALDAVIPAELGAWVDEARGLRAGWRAAGVPLPARRPLLLEALNRLYDRPSDQCDHSDHGEGGDK